MHPAAYRPSVLITGVGGFIGGFLACELSQRGYRVSGTARDLKTVRAEVVSACEKLNSVVINGSTSWSSLLSSSQSVIHCAAHVHVRRPSRLDQRLFREVNVDGTRALAEGCRDSGAPLLVNLSSIAAETQTGDEKSSGYGASKREAERAIAHVLAGSAARHVNLRLPAVYGPEGKGALGFLFRWVRSGLPIPVMSMSAKRSYLSVWNLADCVAHCLEHPGSTPITVAIADERPLDLSELLSAMASAASVEPRFLDIGAVGSAIAAFAVGRRREFRRGMVETMIDPSVAARELGWFPPVSASEGWRRVADFYATRGRS